MTPEQVPPDSSGVGRQLERNIAAILRLEQLALENRPFGDRVAAAIGGFVGSIKFIVVQVALFVAWLVVNRPTSPFSFDPYPHTWLMLMLGIETIVLSTFVLINQQQAQKLADRRAQLNLQIDLLAESEMTRLLLAFQTITEHLDLPGMEDDQELRDLSARTEVEEVVHMLDEQISATTEPDTEPDRET